MQKFTIYFPNDLVPSGNWKIQNSRKFGSGICGPESGQFSRKRRKRIAINFRLFFHLHFRLSMQWIRPVIIYSFFKQFQAQRTLKNPKSVYIRPRYASGKEWPQSGLSERIRKREGKKKIAINFGLYFHLEQDFPSTQDKARNKFSDNLEHRRHWKFQNPSKFGLNMPVGKSGLQVRTNQEIFATIFCWTKRTT